MIEELKQEEEKGRGNLSGFFEAFKKFLIAGLTRENFADLYAQTITYGLFAARTRTENGFSRKAAFDNIPHTIGILREVFQFVSLGNLPKQMEVIIDDISEVLAVADVNQILHKYFHEGKGRDPIVHFYETFLAEYDPATREKRGVYYTPEPVVSYIVRSLHEILKTHFGKTDGFASSSVRVLDPAAGTLTFLAEAAKLAVEEFTGKYGEGGQSQLIKDQILQNFYAFELMMAPYAIGHLKMAFLLEELGYRLSEDERIKLYLTNTLEMEDLEKTSFPGMSSLAEESHLAGVVKKETPILVILGNPPYSGISKNTGKWITDEIETYKYVDGKHFGEKKHWLQDDYVKFIRFAQWKIDQAGEGVLGFITNHGYLDNPTFRGMRQSLMNTFDEIYLLDLHGNSLKKEKCPDGSPDENVFDIRQGVAIALFVKKEGLEKQINHADLWGLREAKYDWLLNNDVKTTDWQELTPTSPYYFFIKREEAGKEEYDRFQKITDIFPLDVTGVITARDGLVIDFDKHDLRNRISAFKDISILDETIKTSFKLKNTRGWDLGTARRALSEDKDWESCFAKIQYRPFDIRDIYYSPKMIDWPRQEVMRHMLKDNLAVVTCRQLSSDSFTHTFCSQNIIEDSMVSNKTKEIGYVFPLYLYPDEEKQDLFSTLEMAEKKPNIDERLYQKLTEVYGQKPTPEEIFYYIYGVHYCPTYRTKYAEFLKIDFPRIPFTADREVFDQIGKLGKRLVDLHLVKSEELNQPIARFPGSGGNLVEKPVYDAANNRVNINKDQYFDGIPADVWQYQIGGYQVLHKWLKDRKGRYLSSEDIRHYCLVATAIQKTIEIQAELDSIYGTAEKETIDFKV